MLELLTQKDEYLHVLINSLPTHGLALAVIGLFVGYFINSRPAKIVGLTLIFLCSLAAWPTFETGEEAYDIIQGKTDDEGGVWLDHHAHRAELVLPFFYVVAALAACAVVLPLKYPKSEKALTGITLIAAIALIGAGGWVAYSGGKIMHKEFRVGSPPPALPKGGAKAD